MRVLHVIRHLGVGGMETFVLTMRRALQTSCDMQVFSLFAGRAYTVEELDNCQDDGVPPSPFPTMRRLARHMRQWRPDVIHMHADDGTLYASVAAAWGRIRAQRIAHWHVTKFGSSRTPVGRALNHWALSGADAFVACSQAALSASVEWFPHVPERRYCLYNPIDVKAFSAALRDPKWRRLVRCGDDAVLAVFLGRIDVHGKGLDVLCAAVRLLPSGFPLRVALVGPGDLEAVREQLDPPEAVRLTGPADRTEVPGVLRACDICLQPSRSEGLGISIIEAMAAGLPVIATRVGGIPEAVEDGVTGMLVPPEDPQALADAIRWMVEHPAECAEMGRRGSERARLFDVHTIAGQLEAIYHEVLHG